MKYLAPFVFACLWVLSSIQVLGQQMSISERLEVIVQSRQLIRDYEDLLILLSDESTSQTVSEILIRNSYQPGRNQIFFGEDVVLENDVNPRYTLGEIPPEDLSVSEYLQYFFFFYNKSRQPTVSFSNIRELTDVEEETYKFVRIYFESEFQNGHKEVDIPFQPTKRIAEIRIERDGDTWRPYINGITYFSESPVSSSRQTQTPPPVEAEPEIQEKDVPVVDPDEEAAQPVTVQPDPEQEVEPAPTEVENANAYRFVSPSSETSKKFGETLSVSWMNQLDLPDPVELRLLKNGSPFSTLSEGLSGTNYSWYIDKNEVKKGTYELEVRNKESNQSYGVSPEIKIKSKFPLILAIGIPVAVGGVLAAVLGGDGGGGNGNGGGPDGPDPLPPAPDPGSN